jgi:hypothetical protein
MASGITAGTSAARTRRHVAGIERTSLTPRLCAGQ